MVSEKTTFEALLKHLDGKKTTMVIPGIRHDNGYVFVPESLTLENGQHFLLNKKIKILDYFEYHETQLPKIPYREDLH